jgi:hypothetical protein
MDCEHRALLISTAELIQATRDEILRVRKDVELARDTVAKSQTLLSRTTSPAHYRREAAKRL